MIEFMENKVKSWVPEQRGSLSEVMSNFWLELEDMRRAFEELSGDEQNGSQLAYLVASIESPNRTGSDLLGQLKDAWKRNSGEDW